MWRACQKNLKEPSPRLVSVLHSNLLTTLRKVLVSPKDKTNLEKRSGVVYSIKCKDCDSLYIGESGRNLEKRLEEHKSKAASFKSVITEHDERSKGHNIDWENVKVLEREPRDFPSKILEAIHIRTLNPKLNRDKGLELDPVWDNLLATKDTKGPSGNSSLTSTSDEVVHH